MFKLSLLYHDDIAITHFLVEMENKIFLFNLILMLCDLSFVGASTKLALGKICFWNKKLIFLV